MLCVCGYNFSILKGDGKEVRETDGIYIPIRNDFKKVYRINNNICAGFTGDSHAVKFIVSNLYRLNKCSVEECKKEILSIAKALPLNGFGLNFIVTGIENHVCKTYTFKSKDNFKEDLSVLSEPGIIMTCFAPPIDIDTVKTQNIINKHINSKTELINSVEQIRNYMDECILEISKISKTVNDIIYGEEIYG